MKFSKLILFVLLLNCFARLGAQRFTEQVPHDRKYTVAQAYDPDYGITMYNKMIQAIGGDLMRFNKSGYNLQGWQEDFYESGKLLHRGFYMDGLIKVFKNYFESGQVERNFVISDPKRSSVEIYYEDGKVRSQINFFDGNAQKEYDYYPNGSPEFIEESDKNIEFLYKRNSYYPNGIASSLFELIDKKSKKYIKKEFYESGKLKEEGEMSFRKDMLDYVKEGEWTYYDEKGAVSKKEKYQRGEKL